MRGRRQSSSRTPQQIAIGSHTPLDANLVSGHPVETANGHWINGYDAMFTFTAAGRAFIYGQCESQLNWFIQPLTADGKLDPNETDHGRFANFYDVQVPFAVGTRTFFFATNASRYCFIQELTSDGKMGGESFNAHLDQAVVAAVVLPSAVLGSVLLLHTADGAWAAYVPTPSGLGAPIGGGRFNGLRQSLCAFDSRGTSYLYAQGTDTGACSVYRVTFSADGLLNVELEEVRRGVETVRGTQSVFRVAGDASAYLYAQASDKSWVVRRVYHGFDSTGAQQESRLNIVIADFVDADFVQAVVSDYVGNATPQLDIARVATSTSAAP